ncbi:hypothetical protein [Streptomyces sp. NPDC087307]|uniref:hypothetical protein n=1 Tax=Streptomyces sp. NPDC087307 TaxID=3365782 RepID=UPI003815ECA1
MTAAETEEDLRTALATAAALLRFTATCAEQGHDIDTAHLRAAAADLTAIATQE